MAAPAMPPGGWPHNPVEEALKLAAHVVHEQEETIERLLRCLMHCCRCHDDDDDRDRDRDRRGDRDHRRERRDDD
jgi:hypothetical protein